MALLILWAGGRPEPLFGEQMKSPQPSLVRRLMPTCAMLALIPGCYVMCPYNVDQFIETQTRAECHFWFSCCVAGEHATAAATGRGFPDLSRFRDEEHCVTERLEEGSALNDVARAFQQAEQGGRFRFDAAQMEECQQPRIDALNNCDADFVLGDAAPIDPPDACDELGTGLVVDGGDCFFGFECADPGSDCLPANVLDRVDPDPSEPTEVLISRPSICIAPLKDGDDCSPDPDRPAQPTTCDPGLICFTSIEGTDISQICEPPHAKDEDCNSAGDCDVGLFCAGQFCDDVKEEGDPCNGSEECKDGLRCDAVDADAELVCVPPLPVIVEICNGIEGTGDVVYPSKP